MQLPMSFESGSNLLHDFKKLRWRNPQQSFFVPHHNAKPLSALNLEQKAANPNKAQTIADLAIWRHLRKSPYFSSPEKFFTYKSSKSMV
jgi:hypothetical protein